MSHCATAYLIVLCLKNIQDDNQAGENGLKKLEKEAKVRLKRGEGWGGRGERGEGEERCGHNITSLSLRFLQKGD